MAVFDPHGALIEFDAPLFLPSPPKRLHYKRSDPKTSTAADAGYSDEAAPTKFEPAAQKKDIKRCAMVRYILNLELTRDDVEALWPDAQITTDTDYRKFLDAPVSQWQAEFGNSLMSTCGERSSEKWLTRLITGTVELYDFRVRMFNLQCEIATCQLENEWEEQSQKRERLELLGLLRLWYWHHRDKMLHRIDQAREEVRSRNGDLLWQESYGNTDKSSYIQYLHDLYTEFSGFTFLPKPQDSTCIPERRLLYLEEFGLSYVGLGFRQFWDSVWHQEGIAESFYSEFDDVLYIKACVGPDAPDACLAYFQWLFESVCHYSYVSQIWRIHENISIAQRAVYRDIRGALSLPLAPKVVFDLIRDKLRNVYIPFYDEIIVRATGNRRTKKRGRNLPKEDNTHQVTPTKAKLSPENAPNKRRRQRE